MVATQKKTSAKKKLQKDAATFLALWDAYPWPPTVKRSRGGYANECAIRMSIALEAVVPTFFKNYTEPKSPEGWARGAESLANFIWKYHLGRPKIYSDSSRFKTAERSTSGIVFFKDCFVRTGQKLKRGDHIDLWSGGQTLSWDDPNNQSEQVWYWKFA